MAFRIRVRMNRARTELPHHSVAEVARHLGYSDPKHFSRIFKKYTGVSPRDFKKLAEQNGGFVDLSAL